MRAPASKEPIEQTIQRMEAEIAQKEKRAEQELADPKTHDLGIAHMDLVEAHRKLLELIILQYAPGQCPHTSRGIPIISPLHIIC